MLYPYSQPLILTDSIFVEYLGVNALDQTSKEQRKIAYAIAEEFASDEIDTYFTYTTVTGTFTQVQFAHPTKPLILEHAYVNSINLIRFYDVQENNFYTISGTANVYASLRNAERGIVDIHYLFGSCQCLSSGEYPYKIEIIYNTGLSSGTVSSSNRLLMALATGANMVLNEMIGYGNEAPGLVGVDTFSSQDYSEKRHSLKNTVFGSSAKAQFVSTLLQGATKLRYVGM